MEGVLDAPLTSVVRSLGRGDENADPVRVAMVLNFVGRTLRDAYGRETYRKGLMLAQSDLYYEGSADGMQQVVDTAREESEKMVATVKEAMDGVLAEFPRHLNRRKLAGAAWGSVGGMIASGGLLAMAWYVGILSFN